LLITNQCHKTRAAEKPGKNFVAQQTKTKTTLWKNSPKTALEAKGNLVGGFNPIEKY